MLNKKHKIHTDKVSNSLLNGSKKNKRIELGSISYGDSTPAQNNKLTTLKKIEYLKQAESLGVDKKSALKILKSYLANKKNNQPELN